MDLDQQLSELVRQYPINPVTELRRTESLLRDYCGDEVHPLKIKALSSAIRSGVVVDLAAELGSNLDETAANALIQRIIHNRG